MQGCDQGLQQRNWIDSFREFAAGDRPIKHRLQQTTFADAVKAGLAKIDGDAAKLDEFASMLDTFKVMFEVIEPKP